MKYKELINMINKEDYKNALYLIDNYIHLSNDEKNGKEDIDINYPQLLTENKNFFYIFL